MPRKQVNNFIDTFVKSVTPKKNFSSAARMQVRQSSGDNRRGLLTCNIPFPRGVRVISAKLQLFNISAIAGSYTLTAQRINAKWGINKVDWDSQPGVVGATATVTKTGAAAETLWELDVTAIMQAVSNGAEWYGFRIDTTTTGTTGVFRAAQSGIATRRPTLIVQWSEKPNKPTTLSPSGGRAVNTQKPLLSYDFSDPNGEGDLAWHAIQIFTAAVVGTPEFDTGLIGADLPELDLAATAYAGLPSNGASRWWRVQAMDLEGNTSPWSDLAEMKYAAKGVLTMVTPAGTSVYRSGSPSVTWTFTGQTQKSYQLYVAETATPNKWIWDSGKITSTALGTSIPFGVLTDPNKSYRFGLRVWDNLMRQGVPGNPAYVEVTKDLISARSGTVNNVTALVAQPDGIKPNITFTWSRDATPDEFQIQRSSDGGTNWVFYKELLPADVDVVPGGLDYTWTDYNVDWYRDYTYRFHAVVADIMSNGVSVNTKATKLAPFLMRPDGSDLCCFINNERSRERMDKQEVHQRLEGAPVLVTQSLGGFAGTLTGRFIDGFPAGVTATQMKNAFERIRNDPGCLLKLTYAGESLDVVAYEMTWDSFVSSAGLYYVASFKWIQVW